MFEKNVGRKNMKSCRSTKFLKSGSFAEDNPEYFCDFNNYTGPGIALNTRLSIILLIISRYYIMIIIAQTT